MQDWGLSQGGLLAATYIPYPALQIQSRELEERLRQATGQLEARDAAAATLAKHVAEENVKREADLTALRLSLKEATAARLEADKVSTCMNVHVRVCPVVPYWICCRHRSAILPATFPAYVAGSRNASDGPSCCSIPRRKGHS